MAIINHLIYLSFSVAFTVFVGQTLFRHGRTFLLECFPLGDTADSVNRLFLVGFYLLNSAFVCIALRFGETATSWESSFEIVANRVGVVALVMGGMHFNNLFWCNLIRQRRLAREAVNTTQ
jgi:hypothetical protein